MNNLKKKLQDYVNTPVSRLYECLEEVDLPEKPRTQGEIAAILGISQQYFSDILGGKTKISTKTLYKLQRNLNINPAYILEGELPKFCDNRQTIRSGDNSTLSNCNIIGASTDAIAALSDQLRVKDEQIATLMRIIENNTKKTNQ